MDRMKSFWDSLMREPQERYFEETIPRQEVSQLREALRKRASELLFMFEGSSRHSWLQEYRNVLSSCISDYGRIAVLRVTYKKQSIVLESYYQRNKLRDYMEQMVAFVQTEPRSTDTAEKLAVKGYSNYLFVIKCTMKDMEENLKTFAPAEADTEITARTFLRLESAGQPLLEQWQNLRKRINHVFQTSPSDRREYTRLMQDLDELEVAFRRDHAAVTAFWKDKQSAMLPRLEKMEAEIQTGEELGSMLTQLFTDALFEAYDPDASDDWNRDIQQVKEDHRVLAEQMQLILDRFPRQ